MRFSRVPSSRRTSPQVGVNPRAVTAAATPLAQSRDGVRRKKQPEAELPRGRRALEDADLPPRALQGDPGGETADAGTRDQGRALHGGNDTAACVDAACHVTHFERFELAGTDVMAS